MEYFLFKKKLYILKIKNNFSNKLSSTNKRLTECLKRDLFCFSKLHQNNNLKSQ